MEPETLTYSEQEAQIGNRQPDRSGLLAAIDLGSNSFHLVVARQLNGEIRLLERLGEKVQLAAGLDAENMLDDATQQRALDCLRRFSQCLRQVPRQNIRIVGTNALRKARNSLAFILEAEKILKTPIHIIAGREEARLIYLGVSQALAHEEKEKRLVIDIGGGSTEFVIGCQHQPNLLESLHMGCVTYSKRFFPGGVISKSGFEMAKRAAESEIANILSRYQSAGWDRAIGSSGTMRVVEQMLISNGWSDQGITQAGVQKIIQKLLKFGHVNELRMDGLKADRADVIAGGLAIIDALFSSFQADVIHYASGALREGLLYDLMGRLHHQDIRLTSLQGLLERNQVDQAHATAVHQTANLLLAQVKTHWQLEEPLFEQLLGWACQVHEIGLSIAHTQFHKHGAYLIKNSDLSGFSRQEQEFLAILVRAHRRKFPPAEFSALSQEASQGLQRLCIILRLSVLLQHSRNLAQVPGLELKVKYQDIVISLPQQWLHAHPLTQWDLQQEKEYLKSAGYQLLVEER